MSGTWDGTSQGKRPIVMWQVTLHCWVEDRGGSYSAREVFAVEAPENDLEAAAQAGMQKLRDKRPRPLRCGVTRIDVKRLNDRTLPSSIAQQLGLWPAPEPEQAGEAQG